MTAFQIASLALGIVSILVLPLLVFVIKGAIKWTRVETKLDQAISRLDTIVRDKDQTHSVMVQQMTEDRKATDQRLRWLEENVWRHVRPDTERRRG